MADIYLIGDVGNEITLDSVISQVNQTKENEPINIHIHSGGGLVYDGLAIYNYLKGLKREVNTMSSGLVASIASVIFLAGNKKTRKINSNDSFLIHLPSGGAMGNAVDLEKVAKELRDIEDKIADIYVKETNITKEYAIRLMKKDEMLDVEFLKENGFISEIVEFKAVAIFKNKDMSENVTMSDLDKKFDTFWDKVKSYFKNDEPKSKVVQDATSVEIDFVDLKESDNINIGDKAVIEGANAKGDYVMPTGETYRFENGELTDIIKAPAEVEALKNEIDELKNQLQESAEAMESKDAEILKAQNDLKNIKREFTEFRSEIKSSFNYEGKEKKEDLKSKSRNLFKN